MTCGAGGNVDGGAKGLLGGADAKGMADGGGAGGIGGGGGKGKPICARGWVWSVR
jgi:hypothetical protein